MNDGDIDISEAAAVPNVELLDFVLGATMTGLLVACFFLWIVKLRRVGKGRPLVEHEFSPNPAGDGFDLLGAFLLLSVFLWLGQKLIEAWSGHAIADSTQWTTGDRASMVALNATAYALMVLASVSLCCLRHRCRPRDLGFDQSRWGRDLRLGVVWFLMLGPLAYAIQLVLTRWFPSEHPLIELIKDDPNPLYFGLSFVSAVLVAPVAEEYLFRGLLQGWLERLAAERTNSINDPDEDGQTEWRTAVQPDAVPRSEPRLWPIVVSSGLFAAIHWQHGPDGIALFVFALGLGLLRQRTGRIWAPVVVHLLLNAITMLALLVSLAK